MTDLRIWRLAAVVALAVAGLFFVAPAMAQLAGDAQSDPQAQFEQAMQYHDGDGVARNYATAAGLFAKAAAQGHAGAQNFLGRYYHVGYGVTADQAQALRWLSAAAQTGDPQYLYDLGVALENGADGSTDPAAAAKVYAQAAEKGHVQAMVSLGVLYQDGRGVSQDYARALALYSQAAKAGNARAINNLGLLHVRGHGVPQDYGRAAKLFTRAADLGLKQAYTNLGVMYENGFGVPIDEARAAELYRLGGQGTKTAGTDQAPDTRKIPYDPRLAPLAADIGTNDAARKRLVAQANAGDPVAQFQLGWLLIQDPQSPHSAVHQAATLFRASAQRGYGPAMTGLGVLHFQGRGVLQDYVQGYVWLTLAEAAGQQDATALAIALSAAMTPAQINQAQAIATARLGH